MDKTQRFCGFRIHNAIFMLMIRLGIALSWLSGYCMTKSDMCKHMAMKQLSICEEIIFTS